MSVGLASVIAEVQSRLLANRNALLMTMVLALAGVSGGRAVAPAAEYPQEIVLEHEGPPPSLSGEKKFTVAARGLPGFKVRLHRIEPKALNHLIAHSSADLSLRPGDQNFSEVFSEVRALDASQPRLTQHASIDVGKYLTDLGEQYGMYFVSVEAWNLQTQQPIGATGAGRLTDQRFVMLTDLGVIDKVDVGLTHWVYVQSFRTGAATGFAQVEVLAQNGSVVLTRATDVNGVATLPSLKDFIGERKPVALVVRKDGDVSFLPLDRSDRSLDLSRFNIGGVRTKSSPAELTAFAFSDRGLYRPGEVVHLSALVRTLDWSHNVKGTPLVLAVTDPRGVQVAAQEVTLDASGLTSMEFKTEDSLRTGAYNFSVVPKNRSGAVVLGSAGFRVEEFLPDRMRLTTRIEGPAEGWVTSTKLKAVAELRNLFGTPAGAHRVSANITLQPYQPQFSKYPDYQFHPSALGTRSESWSFDANTSASGAAEYDIDLGGLTPSTWRVLFFAEGFETGGGRSVSSLATIIASPRGFMLGYKRDGDLNFIRRGAVRSLDVIAIDPKVNRITIDKLRLVLVEQRYVSVLTRSPNGSHRYQSVLKDLTKVSEPFAVAAAGRKLKVPTDEVGEFYWSVRDAADVELLHIPFSVMGDANVEKELEKNAELKVTLDKAEYEPGEAITVQIAAPYTGAGVITIERDKVLAHQSFKASTFSTLQTIKVPSGLDITGYVNVAFVRSVDSPERYISPLSYGVVPFKVIKKAHHLQLTVETPDVSEPGRAMTIAYKTDRPAKVVLFAADDAILWVSRYEAPDPLAFFLSKRALEVSTWQSVDPSRTLAVSSTPTSLRAPRTKRYPGNPGNNLNPFERGADLPAVFWSGIVDAGPEEKTLSFTVPQSFTGQLRVMAVAASPEALAAAQTKTTIRGPYVITPNAPSFVSPNDTFMVTAAIENNVEGSGAKAEVTVSIKPSAAFELAAGAKATQTLTIGERREAVASFEVKALDALGDGELKFEVSGSNRVATRTAQITIRASSEYRASAQVGIVKRTVELRPTRTMFEAFARRELTVSLLPLGMASGVVSYLGNADHFSSEQLISRVVPALVLMNRPEWSDDHRVSRTAFERAFSAMRARQSEQGRFGYWEVNSTHSETLDAFITLTLTEARERGVVAPADEVRLKALENLKRATVPVSTIAAARVRAQQLYVLARNDVVASAPTAQLAEFLSRQSETSDVAFAYLAATYALTHNPERANEVIKRFTLADDVVPDEAFFYDASVYRSQALYLLAKHFPSMLDVFGDKVLPAMAQTFNRSDGTHSLSAAWALFGLDAYSTALEKAGARGGLKSVTIESKDVTGVWKKQQMVGLTAKVGFDHATTDFRVSVGDGSPVFYSLNESGFERVPPKTAIAEGLEVIQTFEDEMGKPVSTVELGSELVVRLQTHSLGKSSLGHIAITDFVPSGFEVVMNRGTDQKGLSRLDSSGSNWSVHEVDIRDDRVRFYGTVEPTVQEVKYRIKAVAKGTFIAPPAQAVGMRRPELRARSLGGWLVVE